MSSANEETHNRVLPKQERTLLWVLSLLEQTFLRFSAYAENRRTFCRDVREKYPSRQDDRLRKQPEHLRRTQAALAAYWDRLLQVACPIIVLGSYAQYDCPGTDTAVPGQQKHKGLRVIGSPAFMTGLPMPGSPIVRSTGHTTTAP